MIVPHDAGGRTLSVKIPALWLKMVTGVTIFSILMFTSLLVYSSMLSRRLVHYHKAIAKNVEQKEVIESFGLEAAKVNQAIAELRHEDNQLRKLLGLKSWKSKIQLTNNYNGKGEDVTRGLKVADVNITERKRSYEELKSWVNTVRNRFATTPSSWPLYGSIVSGFGYRVYPWRGFHSGLDISGQYGASVRATADGTVSYAGWRNGFGKTVEISHGYGIETLYGHASRLAVSVGQRVKKGQVLCYIGTTGYSTGPHLHYEVRKGNNPTNPVAFLGLNILSASKVWRQ